MPYSFEPPDSDDLKLTQWQKVVLVVTGKVCVGHYKKNGWKSALPFYAARCRVHGLYVSYEIGEGTTLRCPKCEESEKP